MDEKLRQIADHYGEKAQLEQLIKESVELIVAVKGFLREPSSSKIEGMIEEIADVEIMLEQMKYLFGISFAVEEIKATKIERTLKRIGQEEEK